jgi:Ca2+-binding RTX toxin-like protein
MARRGNVRLLGLSAAVRKAVSLASVTAVVITYGAATVTVARAVDPPSPVAKGLVQWFAYLGGLSATGPFATDLTGTTLAVGGPAGLDLKGLTAEAVGKDWATATSTSDLVSKLNALDGTSGSWWFNTTASDASVAGITRVTVSMTVTRSVATGLSLHDPGQAFDLTSPAGVSAALSLSTSFTADDDGTNFWIEHDASSPSLAVHVGASIPTPGAIKAGLGILGVTLSAATFSLDGGITTAFADPNADGRLAFTEPGGAAGELSSAGSAGGVAVPTVAPGGSLSGSLTLAGESSPLIPGLPSVSATVGVSSTDLAGGKVSASIAPGAFDTVKPFQTLGVKDLGTALAQMAVTLQTAARAKDRPLPLLHGSIADAVQSAQAITGFLTQYVTQPPKLADAFDPTKYAGVGDPKFASLQDLVEKLQAYTDPVSGAQISLSPGDVSYDTSDAAKPKIRLTLHLGRHASVTQPLDVAGPTLTGSGSAVSYGPTYLLDTSKAFTADLANRQVVAGGSTALIDKVDPANEHKLLLSTSPYTGLSPQPTSLWKDGAQPADATAYSIAGQDPRTGQVELANTLKAGSGLLNVNASVPVATIKPSYDVTLPIVLDLEPATVHDPALTVDNPDGTSSVVTSTPTVAQRIMLHTGQPLLSADLPIATQVDATAKVGFLQVHVGGSFQLCTKAAGVAADCSGSPSDGTHFLSISTKDQGDVALPQLFSMLSSNPGDLLDVAVHGKAYGTLQLKVPGADGFFATPEAQATLAWSDVTDPSTLSLTGPDLSKLTAFDISGLDDPTKLFGAIVASLQSLDSSLHSSGSGSGALDTRLPLLGRSVHDLLGGVEQGGAGAVYTASTLKDDSHDFTGKKGRRLLVGSAAAIITDVSSDGHTATFAPAIGSVPSNGTSYAVGDALLAVLDELSAKPSASLNDLTDLLNQRLGTDAAAFSVVPATGGDPAYLKLSISWTRTLPLQVPLKFALNLPGVPSTLAGTQGKGTLDVSATGAVSVKLLLPLTKAAIGDPTGSLLVDPSSGAHVTADINSSGVSLAANLGPLALSVGDPTAADPGTVIHGKLGFALGATGSSPMSLGDFFSGLSVTADRHDDVSCAGVTGSNLALCAALPLYYKSGSTWTKLGAGVTVAVPQAVDFSALSSYVTLPSSATLLAALQSQLIDLSALGNGLSGYLALLNQALQLADTAGKLPVVGGDIQQGLDFINGIKDAVQSVMPVDLNDGSEKVDSETTLQNKLNDVSVKLPGHPTFYVAADCSAKLDQVTNLRNSGSHQGSSPATHYIYRVVAVRSGNTTGDARPSATLDLVNIAALTATDFNKVTWDASQWATGYRVERQVGADWKVLGTTNGQGSVTFTDDGSVTPTTAAPVSAPADPVLSPCPGSAINGFRVKVVVGQGNPSAASGCTDASTTDTCVSAATRPLDLGLPGLSLSTTDPANPNDLTDPSGGVQAKLGWKLHMSFGLTRDKGFVVYTQDNDSDPKAPSSTDKSTPELLIGAAIAAPKHFNGRLAFLSVQAVDVADSGSATAHRSFTGAFSVDLHGVGATPCPAGGCDADLTKLLTLDDILSASPSGLVTAKLQAAVALDYRVTVRSDAALPGIRADFHLGWSWASGAAADDTSGLSIGFQDVRVNPGAFLQSVLGPIFEKINALYAPIKPVLDTVSAPIPVLSDLSHLAGGSDVSILTLAAAFADGSGDAATFDQFVKIFKNVKDVLAAINAVTGACGSGTPNYDDDVNFCIKIGSFGMDPHNTFSTTSTPDTADSLLKSPTPDSAGSLFTQLDNKTGGNLTKADAPQAASGDKNACGAAADDRGFTFTALKDPTSLFGLLLGKDIELVCFDSGPLTLGFTMSESFGPVYAPPPVLIVISGSASVTAHIVAGFDTYGIRKAVEGSDAGSLARAVDFLDSLYFKTVNTTGQPIPVLQFRGELAAGAEVSAVIITVGVVGGVSLTVSFYWNDPDNDGKFRFSEFLATALKNPICLFTVGGELDLFLKVFVTIGFSPFDVSFDFTLVNLKLLDFSIVPDCTPPPPELAGKSGSTLYLFAGRLGSGDLRGDGAYDNGNKDKESVVVRQHTDDPHTVTIQMLGITEDFGGVDKVVLDGRGYGGPIQALFQGAGTSTATPPPGSNPNSPFTLDTVVVGGNGDDVIKTGSGRSWVDAGAGNDQVVAGDRPDLGSAGSPAVVVGGEGNDSLSVGNADDTVFGDGSLVIADTAAKVDFARNNGRPNVQATTLDTSSIGLPADGDVGTGNDRISLGLGHDQAWGGGGDDVVGVAADSPLASAHPGDPAYVSKGVTVHGGPGSDRVSGGSANDTVFTGGTFDPSVLTQDAIADGNGSADAGTTNTVDTGAGTDTVYGDRGADLVTGHSSGTAVDTFYGGPGADVLMGGYGKDQLFGGQDDDYVIAEPSTVGDVGSGNDALGLARTVVHTATSVTPQEKLLVGGGGQDRVYGGDGGAKTYGDHRDFTCSTGHLGADPSSTPPSEAGVGADDQSDLIYGGEGVDDINAGGGNDIVQAKGNDDFLCGSAGKDTLDAGSGADKVWGGSGDDVVYGGDGADHLYGNTEDDTVYGGAGNDVIEGNNGLDTLFGGAQDDTIVGGSRLAGQPDTDVTHSGDTLFGEDGNDLLIGDNGVPALTDSTTGLRVGTSFDLDQVGSDKGEGDHLFGGAGADSGYGGLGNDTMRGNEGDDHLEGGPGSDTVNGDNGRDDIVGGSSQVPSGTPDTKDVTGYSDLGDTLSGDAGDDVVLGDNGRILDTPTLATADDVDQGRGLTLGRTVTPYDLGDNPAAGTSGQDLISGGEAADLLYGQGGQDVVHGDAGDDYVEGGSGNDQLFGDAGQDDIVGGSLFAESGSAASRLGQPDGADTIRGGDDGDVVIGDDGTVDRVGTPSAITVDRSDLTPRRIQLFDLGVVNAHSAGDAIDGDSGSDVLLGQGGNDVVQGALGSDYVEGGPGTDLLEGNAGDDDLVGGSSTPSGSVTGDTTAGQPDSADLLYGGAGDDVALGDNGVITRVGPTFDPRTFRIGSAGTIEARRTITAYDLRSPAGSLLTAPSGRFGNDQLSGGSGVDVLLGQDGQDTLTGAAGDDYVEGNGGDDLVYGDTLLSAIPGLTPLDGSWLPRVAEDRGETDSPNGQDDLIGGSTTSGFRDGNDVVHGDGGADYELGDNGQVVRDILSSSGVTLTEATASGLTGLTDRVYTKRYPGTVPDGAAYVRHGTSPTTPTRFCTTAQVTCEVAGAYGDDTLYGDAGDDTAYGQDGNDTISGGAGDDDLYGELGDDTIYGDAGNDAILGDRGGIVDTYQAASGTTDDYNQVPKLHYVMTPAGSVTRQVDLQHDVNGDAFIGTATDAPMPYRGDREGGNDRIRGGAGNDSIHGGAGDDLANGDSGGDITYGDDGADVLWGGKGSDDPANPNDRGVGDSLVDYTFGGKGGVATDTKKSTLGSDIIDWRPRGSYATPGVTCSSTSVPIDTVTKKVTTTVDPCAWFEMTDMTVPNTQASQHHQGIDWIYGGWDRDVLQGDVADNGPNAGDRLLDWNGTYNLYSHCNAAYGGYNDVRQHSPDMQTFLQKWAYSTGAGQGSGDVTTSGTSAFDELALAYPGSDNAHASGAAFPSTPGHFDDPNACTG